jgi:hypothetical protein
MRKRLDADAARRWKKYGSESIERFANDHGRVVNTPGKGEAI